MTPPEGAAPGPKPYELTSRETRPAAKADTEALAMLVRRGEQFIAVGDIVSARVLLQRAAEVRDARAALALGATYDPIALERLGVRGIAADIAMARSWYEKARDFGSPEAQRRLDMLAKRAN
jgi:TPR repeat protein